MKKTTSSLLILVFILSVCAFSQISERTISVTGRGTINIEPNVAYVRFGIQTNENTAVKAQNKNAEAMKNLVKALKDSGIAEDKIETSNFSLNPMTKRDSNKKIKVIGYRCDNQIQITIDDLTKVGNILDTGIIAGANNVNSLRFSIKDESKYKHMALEKAVEDARGKARAIEKAARLQIKKIHSISEQGANIRPFKMSRASIAEVRTSPETPVMAGKIQITANVQVNFEY